MEDYIIREIDRLGEMLLLIARKLGLPSGNKWANVNMGAALPTDAGAYYAWGELTPKVTYWWKNYKWGGNRRSHVSKYCPSNKSSLWDGEGAPDNIMLLDPADDAAIAGWGESWKTPSLKDYGITDVVIEEQPLFGIRIFLIFVAIIDRNENNNCCIRSSF